MLSWFGVHVILVPFLVVGYGTLGLLAALALDGTVGTGAVLPGLAGAFACVSCTAPLLAGVAGAVGAGSLAAGLTGAAYPLGTAAFLAALGGFVLVLARH